MSYNGWTNYATWRVNLEMLDCFSPDDMNWTVGGKISDLADTLKDYVLQIMDESPDGFVKDYAMAFICDVNWYEIATAMIEAYADENESEDA